MNRETVIERLYKAFNVSTTDSNVNIPGLHAVLDALVAAEREACAKVCEDEIKRVKPIYSVVAENALKAIRARGEK